MCVDVVLHVGNYEQREAADFTFSNRSPSVCRHPSYMELTDLAGTSTESSLDLPRKNYDKFSKQRGFKMTLDEITKQVLYLYSYWRSQ